MRFLKALIGTCLFASGLLALGVMQAELIANLKGVPSGTPEFLRIYSFCFGFGLMGIVIVGIFYCIYNAEKK